ncbi:MAG: hypothetical protein ACTIMQ_07975, partial [Acinetobacter guillouiae]
PFFILGSKAQSWLCILKFQSNDIGSILSFYDINLVLFTFIAFYSQFVDWRCNTLKIKYIKIEYDHTNTKSVSG